jgi:hypothetical protein
MVLSTGLLYSLDLGQAHCQAQEIFWERLNLEQSATVTCACQSGTDSLQPKGFYRPPTAQPTDRPTTNQLLNQAISHSLYPIGYIWYLIITTSRPTDSSLPPSLSLNSLLTLSLPQTPHSYSPLSSPQHTPMGRRKIDIQPLTVSRIPSPDAYSPLISLQNERNRLVTFQKVSQAWSSPSSRLAHLYRDRLLFWVPSLCRSGY